MSSSFLLQKADIKIKITLTFLFRYFGYNNSNETNNCEDF